MFKAKGYLVFVWVEMDMNEMRKLIVVVGIVLVLSGCNRDIGKVKDQAFALDATFTNEQIFESRKICESVQWESFADEKGRTIVEVRCQFKDVKKNLEDYYAHRYASIIDIPRQQYEQSLGYKRRDVEFHRSRVEYHSNVDGRLMRSESEQKLLEETQKELNERLEEGAPDPLQDVWTIHRLKELNLEREGWPTTAYDIYQWAFINEKPILINYTSYKVFSDGSKKEESRFLVSKAIRLAASSNESYPNYLKELNMMLLMLN